MKLYTAPGSCSSASHISLIESGLDYEAVMFNLRETRTLPDGRDLSAINPKGYVPVLELDNGEFLTENVAILQYIADQAPGSKLAPPNGTLERVRLQEWLAYINSEIHKTCALVFMPGPDEIKDAARKRIMGRIGYIDEKLADKDFLMGGQFTVADAYLFIVLSWAPMIQLDLSGFANIQAYLDRVAGMDCVKRYREAVGQ